MVDTRWPRTVTWPEPRPFDRAATLARLEAMTTAQPTEVGVFDQTTRTFSKKTETHYILSPSWRAQVPQPDLGRDEAWVYYTTVWKREATPLADATSEALPASPLERVRADLVDRVRPTWFDDIAYWYVVAGLLTRADLARYIGDGRIFLHKMEGGASIITAWSERVSFVESCYQTVIPRLGAAEWDIIAAELGPVTPAALASKLVHPRGYVASHWLRLAAASGRHDDAVVGLVSEATAVDRFDILHALRDPAHLATHAPRLDLRLAEPLALEKWLDRFGATQPDWIVESINRAPTKKEAAPLVATLAKTDLPADQIAPIMERIRDCKAKPDVDKWLARSAKAATKPAAKKSAAKKSAAKR